MSGSRLLAAERRALEYLYRHENPFPQRNETMTTKATILVVAEREDHETIGQTLGPDLYAVQHVQTADEAFGHVDRSIDLVICNLCVRGQQCHELMRRWHEVHPTTAFILLAGSAEVAAAIEAMKHGAADYVTKPINGDELLVRVVKWLELSRKDERLQLLESQLDHGHNDDERNGTGIDIPAGTSLEELERVAVERALEQHRGNRTHAAKTLGISVRTLQRKLKAWHVPVFALQHQPARQSYSVPIMR
jgi:DNA-binding NtrC family response regulator